MEMRLKERELHPSCGDCHHKYPPEGHGTVLDHKKVRYEYIKKNYKGETVTIKEARTKINPTTCTEKNEKGKPDLSTGTPYPHQFKDLQVTCLGLGMDVLRKQDYPWINSHPPCFMERRYDKDRSD